MKSFEDLCKENYERIYKYIYLMIGDIANSEDITQEVFLVAYKKGRGFTHHDNSTAFLLYRKLYILKSMDTFSCHSQ